MLRSVLLPLLLAFCLVFSQASGAPAETVWSGLVIATNVAQPTPIPSELHRMEGTLKHLFGYNQFQVIGQAREQLKSGDEDWRANSKYFSLRVDSKAAKTPAAYLLKLQLFQEQKMLLETEARLSKSSPLVSKGPQVGAGQLLLVLVLQ
ncbi:MAG: hypothetical protein ACR2NX_07500 [Chthoniobacterales bacterium]